jgi:hypothetical protein
MLPGITFPSSALKDSPAPQTVELTSGSGNWTVPEYNQIVIEIWGGGGRGGGYNTTTAATATTLTLPSGTMTANAGNNGSFGTEGSVSAATGGTASGGDVNTTGGSGVLGGTFSGAYGRGGNAPNGQTINGGVGTAGAAGTAPGGGGSSSFTYDNSQWQLGSGGGAGGYSRKTLGPGDLTPFSTLAYSVGRGAVASNSIGNGGAGRVLIRVS